MCKIVKLQRNRKTKGLFSIVSSYVKKNFIKKERLGIISKVCKYGKQNCLNNWSREAPRPSTFQGANSF